MNSKFPKKGDKLCVKKVFPEYFYPHFINMVEDGDKNLEPGKEYTIRNVEIYSSWVAIWLEELPDTEERNRRYFNLSFFLWDY